jgi:hypothetical protein
MSSTPDGTAAGSWMQGVQPDDSTPRTAVGEAGMRSSGQARGAGQGWDPYEVWLTRIERPRRRRGSISAA